MSVMNVPVWIPRFKSLPICVFVVLKELDVRFWARIFFHQHVYAENKVFNRFRLNDLLIDDVNLYRFLMIYQAF